MFNLLNTIVTFLFNSFTTLGNFMVSDPLLSIPIASAVLYGVIRFFKNLRHK